MLMPNLLYIHFFYYLKKKTCRQINVRENFSFSNENIATILELHPNPNVVTKIDFNFCYWVNSQKLCDFVKQCTNLKDLSVAHSTISNHDLAEILAGNENISKLSFSIESPDTFWSRKNVVHNVWLHDSPHKRYNSSFRIDCENLISLSQFGKCRNTMAQLKSLEIYMQQYPSILVAVLRYIYEICIYQSCIKFYKPYILVLANR